MTSPRHQSASSRRDPDVGTNRTVDREFSRDELVRYARHLILPWVGEEGQDRLRKARVLLVGAGGLGSPAALYLAAAGVGTIGMVDFDEVELTNLQRQILHGTSDVGRVKLDSAVDRLTETNPHVTLVRHDARLTSENALEVLGDYDVVVDGSDNFPTRYLVNDACVILRKPNVYGSVFRWEGQVSVFAVEDGPCYRCLFREPPPPDLVPSCAEGGVLGVLPGVIGSLQALEALKQIVGAGAPLVGRLLLFDALEMAWREVRVRRNPGCPVCGDFPTQKGLIDYEVFCGYGAAHLGDLGADFADSAPTVPTVGALDVYGALQGEDPPLLLDVREAWEWRIGNLSDAGARWIPHDQLAARWDELPRGRDIVVYCRSGRRSADAVAELREAGFTRAYNLRGGLLAWAAEVDASMPRY